MSLSTFLSAPAASAPFWWQKIRFPRALAEIVLGFCELEDKAVKMRRFVLVPLAERIACFDALEGIWRFFPCESARCCRQWIRDPGNPRHFLGIVPVEKKAEIDHFWPFLDKYQRARTTTAWPTVLTPGNTLSFRNIPDQALGTGIAVTRQGTVWYPDSLYQALHLHHPGIGELRGARMDKMAWRGQSLAVTEEHLWVIGGSSKHTSRRTIRINLGYEEENDDDDDDEDKFAGNLNVGREQASIVAFGAEAIYVLGGGDGMERLLKGTSAWEWLPCPVELPKGFSALGISTC